MKISRLIYIFILIGCSGQKVRFIQQKEDLTKVYKIKDVVISPGKVKLITLPFRKGVENTLKCDDNKIALYQSGNVLKGYLAESYFSKKLNYKCQITLAKQTFTVLNVIVKPFKYKYERLYVNKRRIKLKPKDLARVIKEQKMLNQIYDNQFERPPLFEEAFSTPLNSHITSYYGTGRMFNNSKRTQHLGTDYRARTGVKIKPANRGEVVFAGSLFYAGNAVIVYHGIGIYTVYGHLSKIYATKGEIVSKNSVLGLSGSSGRVTGPHLHWGVKINGHWVDGTDLVKQGT